MTTTEYHPGGEPSRRPQEEDVGPETEPVGGGPGWRREGYEHLEARHASGLGRERPDAERADVRRHEPTLARTPGGDGLADEREDRAYAAYGPATAPGAAREDEPEVVAEGERDRPVSLPTRWESLAILAVGLTLYLVLGYNITVGQHVIVFDALDRLTRAYGVWFDVPPKLAAIGFFFPPLTTFVLLPFVAIKPLATSLIALPLSTAVFAAATLMTLNRALARCGMPILMRLGILIAFAINPLFGFYATNGMSEAVYLFFLVYALNGFVSWYMTTQPRYLISAGFGFSLALLTRYGFTIWALVTMVLIGVALVRKQRSRAEVEGATVVFAAPVIYALALWVLFNWVIIGDPLGWLTGAGNSAFAVNSTGKASSGALAFNAASKQLLDLIVVVSPMTLVVLPLLLVAFIVRRDDMALWLASFLALGIIIVGVHALISQDIGLLRLRDAMPMMLVAVLGAGWLYQSFAAFRPVVWALTLAAMLLTLPITWQGMKTYKYQNEEEAFRRAIVTGKDQEGFNSRGGFKVGIDPERQMADYVKLHVSGSHAILTDNAQTFGVILLSGRPGLFFDRIAKGDTRFKQILADPYGKVGYLLVAKRAAGDLIRLRYIPTLPSDPGANSSPDPAGGFTRLFTTDRYALFRVPARRPANPPGQGPLGAPPLSSTLPAGSAAPAGTSQTGSSAQNSTSPVVP